MTIKVAILRTGDQIISDMKEVVSEETPVAYMFKSPQKIVINSPILVTEERERSIELSLSSWKQQNTSSNINFFSSTFIDRCKKRTSRCW